MSTGIENATSILQHLYGVASADKIAEKLVEELRKHDSDTDKLAAKYIPAIWLGGTLGSVAVRYSLFKTTLEKSNAKKRKEMIEKIRIYPGITKYLKGNAGEKAEENKTNKKDFFIEDYFNKIEEMGNNIREIDLRKKNDIYLDDAEAHTNRSKERETAYYCATYLGMVTGRRFTEVVKTMDISRKGRNISISGILKKRSDEIITLENRVLLDDYDTVIKALKILRLNFDATEYPIAIISKKFGLVFRKYLQKDVFGMDKYTFDDLRKMYAQAAWEKYGKDTDIDQKTYIAQVLGHTKKIDQTDHYLTLKSKKDKQ